MVGQTLLSQGAGMLSSHTGKQRVVIIGAGFSGLFAAKHLSQGEARKLVDVTLIDRNNYHTFLPLLYQVAAAELEPGSIAYPIRGVFRPNFFGTPSTVTPLLTEVTGIDERERLVLTDGSPIPYDYLIIAAGSRTAYYGVPGAEENAYGLKTAEEAIALRNHLLSCFERAAMEGDKVPEGLLTVAIVGAGATGLEYAGALAELVHTPLKRDFPKLHAKAKVVLLDAADHVLMPFPQKLRDYARKRLTKMGVEVITGAQAAAVNRDSIALKDGRIIKACTIVWSAGVQGGELAANAGLLLGKGGRIQVTRTLQVMGKPEIYVVGDSAVETDEPAPMLAPAAIQQGTHAAQNILRTARGEAPEEFKYRDKGSMVTIGRNAAVAKIGDHEFTGFPAWVLWLLVHLSYLIGFRNRIMVLISWAWDYLLFERAVRLILPGTKSVLNVCGTDAGECAPAEADEKNASGGQRKRGPHKG